MPKKKIQKEFVEAVEALEKAPAEFIKPQLAKLNLAFNSEDLNQLRDKVNELVDYLNK